MPGDSFDEYTQKIVRVVEAHYNKTAIAIHLYYIEMLDDLCGHLDELRKHMGFDVFVTVPNTFDTEIDIIHQRLKPNLIEPVDNRGRDVLPFIKTLPKLKGYDYACKLHTKRDFDWRGPAEAVHDQGWREYMWSSLTDPVIAEEAKEYINSGFGLYAPKTFWFDGHPECFTANHKNVQRLGEALGVELKSESFVAGTMFWFSPKALEWLTGHDLASLFEPENGSKDGKMEHAFERCFHQLARHADRGRFYKEYKIKGVSVESLVDGFEAGVLHARGDEAYREGDLEKAHELWRQGAELGNEQCRINLETLI
jgi:rhamnosyltransferase